MNLSSKIKSKFNNVNVTELDNDPNSLDVEFEKHKVSVVVTYNPEMERYSASYPALMSDGRGGWVTDDDFSENMLSGGLFWILKQVNKHGKVKPEF